MLLVIDPRFRVRSLLLLAVLEVEGDGLLGGDFPCSRAREGEVDPLLGEVKLYDLLALLGVLLPLEVLAVLLSPRPVVHEPARLVVRVLPFPQTRHDSSLPGGRSGGPPAHLLPILELSAQAQIL